MRRGARTTGVAVVFADIKPPPLLLTPNGATNDANDGEVPLSLAFERTPRGQ
jgi:hypothetical protein